uniref:hypothetical protein n=1 Tax=Lacrimispora sp. TaxID=2719234 RepID=UPI0028B07F58
ESIIPKKSAFADFFDSLKRCIIVQRFSLYFGYNVSELHNGIDPITGVTGDLKVRISSLQ